MHIFETVWGSEFTFIVTIKNCGIFQKSVFAKIWDCKYNFKFNEIKIHTITILIRLGLFISISYEK